jgi:hypothetical protein
MPIYQTSFEVNASATSSEAVSRDTTVAAGSTSRRHAGQAPDEVTLKGLRR